MLNFNLFIQSTNPKLNFPRSSIYFIQQTYILEAESYLKNYNHHKGKQVKLTSNLHSSITINTRRKPQRCNKINMDTESKTLTTIDSQNFLFIAVLSSNH